MADSNGEDDRGSFFDCRGFLFDNDCPVTLVRVQTLVGSHKPIRLYPLNPFYPW
jgi:hypothetical protein